MIPSKIKPYFKKKCVDHSNVTSGNITCCGENAFNIYYNGEIKKSIILGTYLYSIDDVIALSAKCLKCDNIIPIFNSCLDGYEPRHSIKNNIQSNLFNCERCKGDAFNIFIKYEYPDEDELEDLEIKDISNSFTWINVSLICSKCGKKYKSFIDFEC